MMGFSYGVYFFLLNIVKWRYLFLRKTLVKMNGFDSV